MDKDAELLSVENQNENIMLYALVDDQAEQRPRLITIHGTGHAADNVDASQFIGTVKLQLGGIMFHVFGRKSYLEVRE